MKKSSKHIGQFFLCLCSLFIITGTASAFGIGVEEMPKSMKDKR